MLWPVYVPVAVLLMEPRGWRHRALIAFVAASAAVGVYLLVVLVAYPIVSRPTGQPWRAWFRNWSERGAALLQRRFDGLRPTYTTKDLPANPAGASWPTWTDLRSSPSKVHENCCVPLRKVTLSP